MKLHRYLPILKAYAQHTPRDWRGDLVAGLTVGIMLIPQGMAYALLAGLPPIYGLYASTIPLIVYAFLGTSRQLAVGPVAMVSLLAAAGLAPLAEGASANYISLAIALATMVGAIQLGLGLLRGGFLISLLSHPVISGFTSAAALIIGLSQLKHLLGLEIARSHHVHQIIAQAWQQIETTNIYTLAIGLAGILLILGVRRWDRRIPGPLLAVVFGIGAVLLFQLDLREVAILGAVPSGLPSFQLPSWSTIPWVDLIPTALTIALVSFMESIAVAKAIQRKHRDYQLRPNQELIALGLANILGSFFQAYPTTGGFSRTAVNDQAGARSGFASLISAGLIVLTLLFLTPLFFYLPKAILASVIMVAVFGLIDIAEIRRLWRSDRVDLLLLLSTFWATLLGGIELGIGIGVLLSLLVVIARSTRPHIAVLGRIPETHFYRNRQRFTVEEREEILLLRFDAPLYFANVPFFQEYLEMATTSKGDKLQAIFFDFAGINYLDSSAIHALEALLEEYRGRGIELYFIALKGPVRDALRRARLTDTIGASYCFRSMATAIAHFDSNLVEKSPKKLDLCDLHH